MDKPKTTNPSENVHTLEVASTQSSRATTIESKKQKKSQKTMKTVGKSVKKSKKSVKKSVKKSIDKSINNPKKPEKSGKVESKEEMPPTANSEKSAEKQAKKPKNLVVESSKKDDKKPVDHQKIEEKVAPTPIDVAKPPPTPVPTITPGAWSDPAKTPEDLKKKKKEKKRKQLKRETNHIYHLRPGVNKKVEADRQTNFREELLKYETGEFTYLTDPTRYRFRSTPPMEVVVQFVFPSLLILVIALASAAVVQFLDNVYQHEAAFNEMSEMTLSKYDTFMIVENFTEYMNDESHLLNLNCPGLVQGPYRPVYEYEKRFLNYEEKVVKKAWRALTYRWTHQVDAVMNMNFDCPPSVIIEMEKT